DKDLKVTACKGLLSVSAKDEILVTAGGGYIRLKGGNIEIHCPGTVTVKGANHVLSGPTSLNAPLPKFAKGCEQSMDAAAASQAATVRLS
ncbi:DUF2345 domain-containing protein, partial [Iodobacter arcticus]